MADMQLSPVQIQMACAAGKRLLAQDDLMVPLDVAKGGHLGILEQLLGAIAQGQLVVNQAEQPDQEGPQLQAVGGDDE